MKKAFLLLSLFAMASLAQAQSGRWRHFTQINPDTIKTWDCKIINTGNQSWAIWQEGYSYNDTIAMLYFSKYDGNSWAIEKMENTGWYNLFSGFDVVKDKHSNAHVYYYNNAIMMKNSGNQKMSLGVYSATCNAHDSIWGSLSLCFESINILDMKAAIDNNDCVYLLSEEHMHVYSDQGSGIVNQTYDTTWTYSIEATFEDIICKSHYAPAITVDKNDSIWKGWCSTQQNIFPGQVPNWVSVNGKTIDTSSITQFIDLNLVTDSMNKVWAFYNSGYRCLDGSSWSAYTDLGAGSNKEVVVDKDGTIWLACRKADSVIYVNSFNMGSLGEWDSVTTGWVNDLSLDQMGNPCLAWGHDGNIYSAIYCRDSLAPTVSIISPVAGSEYTEGQQVPVHCTYSGDAAFLNIYCRRSGSSNWQKLFDMVPVDSSMNWTVPNDSSDYSFKAEAIDSGWNTSLDSTGWFAVKPLGVQGAPNDQTKMGFVLRNSWPNPFKRSVVINYQLSHAGPVQIKVYNANGQLVKTIVNVSQNAGAYTARWNGNNEQNIPASAGVYICRLLASGQTASIKLIKIK